MYTDVVKVKVHQLTLYTRRDNILSTLFIETDINMHVQPYRVLVQKKMTQRFCHGARVKMMLHSAARCDTVQRRL